jgi:hypothetical protein
MVSALCSTASLSWLLIDSGSPTSHADVTADGLWTGLLTHAMSHFARFSSPSVHRAIMAVAQNECKRPMHVHPHVFEL